MPVGDSGSRPAQPPPDRGTVGVVGVEQSPPKPENVAQSRERPRAGVLLTRQRGARPRPWQRPGLLLDVARPRPGKLLPTAAEAEAEASPPACGPAAAAGLQPRPR